MNCPSIKLLYFGLGRVNLSLCGRRKLAFTVWTGPHRDGGSHMCAFLLRHTIVNPIGGSPMMVNHQNVHLFSFRLFITSDIKMWHIVSEIDIGAHKTAALQPPLSLTGFQLVAVNAASFHSGKLCSKCRPLHTDLSYSHGITHIYPYPLHQNSSLLAAQLLATQNVEFHHTIHFHPVAICTVLSENYVVFVVPSIERTSQVMLRQREDDSIQLL